MKTVGGKYFAEHRIKRGIFPEDPLSRIQLVIVMMPLNYLLKKSKGRILFTKVQENINHFMYVDDVKTFCQKRKETEILPPRNLLESSIKT